MMETKGKISKGVKRKRNWKPVVLDNLEFLSGDLDGFVSLEVLQDEDSGDKSGCKVIKNDGNNEVGEKRRQKKRKKDKKINDDDKKVPCAENTSNINNNTQDEENEWKYLGVHSSICQRLTELGFLDPTPIQKASIPFAINNRLDIIGAAETGSGKTLAYGVPLLHRLLQSKENKETEDDDKTSISAYILVPTRELALQVYKCLQQLAKSLGIKVACIVGGMSEEKQQRILRGSPEIVVATPGRLWYLIEHGEEHLANTSNLKCLVIDEADRMVQDGHYQELTFLMERINNNSEKLLSKMQKFVFSATLTYTPPQKKSKKPIKNNLETLLKKVGVKPKSKIIDLTPKEMTVEKLTESKIMCSVKDKDVYLYYFLKQYPERTLVFVNTIDTLRRLSSILTLLKIAPLPLHAGMQQRQRLKNLDRFKSRASAVLLASDVAARGLDIEGVQHVIHYQIPKISEVYVHRSGRTARIQNEGLSLLLVSPDDLRKYEKIWKDLKKDEEPPDFPVDKECFIEARKRLALARTIDKEEHKFRKKKSSNDWFVTNAKEAELEIDEDLLEDVGDSQEQKSMKDKYQAKKDELNGLLDKPLTSSNFLGKFPTQFGKVETFTQQVKTVEKQALKQVKSKKRKRIKT